MVYALTWSDFQKIFLSSRIGLTKKIILIGRGFRGGSDKKMRRMWLGGLGIVEVGLPPSPRTGCPYKPGNCETT